MDASCADCTTRACSCPVNIRLGCRARFCGLRCLPGPQPSTPEDVRYLAAGRTHSPFRMRWHLQGIRQQPAAVRRVLRRSPGARTGRAGGLPLRAGTRLSKACPRDSTCVPISPGCAPAARSQPAWTATCSRSAPSDPTSCDLRDCRHAVSSTPTSGRQNQTPSPGLQ